MSNQIVSTRLVSRICLLALCIGTIFTMVASAQMEPITRKTKLTFSQPIEIPDVGAQVLPAGTYVFKLLDSKTDRHIVQIYSSDEKHLFATILAVPNYRLKPTDHTVITFTERNADSPQAIRAWFYPGQNWGQEFVYPKARALQLAQATNQPVLFQSSEVSTEISPSNTESVMAINSSGENVPMSDVVEAPPEETQMAAATPEPITTSSPKPEEMTTSSPKPEELPKTGSDLPLIGLIGFLSLAGGLTLRRQLSR